MRTFIRHIVVAATAAAVIGLAAPAARADDPADFVVIVVKATKGGNQMDPALAQYKNLLQGKGFTTFEKLKSAAFKLAQSAKKAVTIAGSLKAELTYTSEINNRIAFKCTVTNKGKEKVSLKYSVPRGGKTLVVVPLGDIGYMLIIKVK